MKTDDFKTEVIFRKWRDADFNLIIALFPYSVEFNGMVTSYEHIGQHSGADYNGVMQSTIPAKESEYSDLKSELESMGYNLNIAKKRNYNRYLTEYRKTRGYGQ